MTANNIKNEDFMVKMHKNTPFIIDSIDKSFRLCYNYKVKYGFLLLRRGEYSEIKIGIGDAYMLKQACEREVME